ncbi:MAG TPA: hypothetical protein VGP84_08410 [Gemmatimonadaceae bacterium]|nr:hypothetical protein [Gemmatimonadaceae bacterium]
MSVSAASAASAVSPSVPRAFVGAERAQRWLPWLVGALALVATMHAIEPLPVGVFYDDAQYLILAKSLATGHGYRFLNLPGAPLATHFPPGYPAFLALLWRIAPAFPENVALFKFANALLLAVVALLAYRFATKALDVPPAVAAAAALAGTATIPSLVLSSAIMSEPLFLALLLPALAWSERESRPNPYRSSREALHSALLLGAAIGGIALVRTHGIALAGAVVATYIARGRRIEAVACAAVTCSLLAPWILWVAAHNDSLPPVVRGAYGSYFGWLATGLRIEGVHLLAVTLPDNVATIWMSIVRSIVPDIHWSIDLVVGVIYAAACLIGIVRCWARTRVMILFIAFYLAIVLVWPFSPLRFVWGIWPLVMLLPAVGVAAAWRAQIVRQRFTARAALLAAGAVLGLGIASFNVRGYANAWWSSNARFHARRVIPQLAWVARATQPRDVVAADAEAAVYLYTGRQAVPITSFTAIEYAHERSVAEEMLIIRQLLDQYRPKYVLATSPQVVDATANLSRSRDARLVRIDSLGQGAVYVYSACMRLAPPTLPPPCE